MLIEFRVENFRSLATEQALTLEAGKLGNENDARPRDVEGHGDPLLPIAVIYGANASGKSNLLNAIDFMRESVIYSHRHWDPDGGVPRTSFAWGEFDKRPSTFEITFLNNETKYQYGFSTNDEKIVEEWLYAWPPPHRRKQTWFERENEQYKFGDHLQGPNESVADVTRPNALFLSSAAQLKHSQLSGLFSWFRSLVFSNADRRLYRRGYSYPRWLPSSRRQMSLFDDESLENDIRTRLRKLLAAADIGIVDVKTVETERSVGGKPRSYYQIMLQHEADNEASWLELENESEGTKTLFEMAPSIFRALDTGALLVVDELESSLHPLLALAILALFNNPKTNPHNSQLLFTTHDTNLLGTIIGEPPLRRDQVWFTEKNEQGQSTLYPLTDFKPRKSENLERGYLQGRYGAIPFLGNIEWIINE